MRIQEKSRIDVLTSLCGLFDSMILNKAETCSTNQIQGLIKDFLQKSNDITDISSNENHIRRTYKSNDNQEDTDFVLSSVSRRGTVPSQLEFSFNSDNEEGELLNTNGSSKKVDIKMLGDSKIDISIHAVENADMRVHTSLYDEIQELTEAKLKETGNKIDFFSENVESSDNRKAELERQLLASNERVHYLEKKLLDWEMGRDTSERRKNSIIYSSDSEVKDIRQESETKLKTSLEDKKKIKELEKAIERLESSMHRGFRSLWSLKW